MRHRVFEFPSFGKAVFASLLCLGISGAQTLRSLAATRTNFHVGTAIGTRNATVDSTLVREFNAIVCENAMKFGSIMTGENAYSYTSADNIINFGNSRGMYVRGHNFIWHKQMPAWFSATTYNPSRDSTFRLMKKYITNVMTHFKGKINEWDIVNEAVARDSAGMRLGTGANPSDQNLKWALLTDAPNHDNDYLDSAFTYARRADSSVLLVYNDYDCEGMGKKSGFVYNVVSHLKSKNLVDVIGLQCHFYAGSSTSGSNGAWVPTEMVENLKRLAALGLKISLTEVDIRVATSPAPDSVLLNKQKTAYQTLMSICLAQPGCNNFILWGINDGSSWVPGSFSGYGQALLFSDNTTNGAYTPKPTYYAVQAAMISASTGILNADHGRLKMIRSVNNDPRGLSFDLRGKRLTSIPYNPSFVARPLATR